MKKTVLTTALACTLATILSMTGCSPSGMATSQGSQPGSGSSGTLTIENMELLTASASGTWVPIGAGIADKFNAFYNGFPLTAVPSSGSLANPPLISQGDGEFGMSYAPFLIAAVNGEGVFHETEPMTNLRAVCALQPTVIQIVADVDDTVESISDVIDQKAKLDLGVPPTGNASNFLATSIFQSAGLSSVDDIQSWGGSIYYASGSNLTDAWNDRHINAYFQTQTVPSSGITEALTGRSGKILAVNGDIAKNLIDNEGFTAYTIPANSYPGQNEDVETVALPIVIFCAEDMDESVVYNLCKAIYENVEDLKTVHSSFNEFNRDDMAVGCGITLHPGAEKFYAEVGLK